MACYDYKPALSRFSNALKATALTFIHEAVRPNKTPTKSQSRDETANVKFFCDDLVHVLHIQNLLFNEST